HPLLSLETRPHDVEDARTETAGGLELVERHDDTFARPRGECPREIECALEEALRIGLARELERELDVLVLDLDRRAHPRRNGLRLLEAALDSRDILEHRVDQTLAESANVRR